MNDEKKKLGKITHVKKCGESISERIFDFEKIFLKKIWAMKGGNNGRRERRNEGTSGMILPRPYSKT